MSAPVADAPVEVRSSTGARLRSNASGPLARVAGSALLTTAVTAGAGFLYWWVAARLSSSAEIGQATAVTATMAVVALLASQTLSTNLLARLPRSVAGTERGMVVAALALAVPGAALLAGFSVLLLPLLTSNLLVLRTPVVAALFTSGAALTAAGLVLDAVGVAVRRSAVGVVRNAVHALGKLAVLPVLLVPFVGLGGLAAVLWSWVGLLTVATWLAVRKLFRILPPAATSWKGSLGAVTHGGLPQTVAVLGGALPPQLLPVLTLALAGAEAAGYFGVAWLLASAAFTVSPAIATGLVSEGARDGGSLAATASRAARLTAALLTVPVLVLAFAGHLPLSLFGSEYSDNSTLLLVLLALAAAPDAVTNIAVALLRVQERLRYAAVVNAGIGVLAVGIAALTIPHLGAEGAGFAWLAAQTIPAALLLSLWHRVSAPPASAP